MIIRSYDHMTVCSHDRAKIQNKFGFQGQQMKCWGSSEMRFGQVSGQSEPSSEGKRTFKDCERNLKIRFFGNRKMKRRESSETRFGQVLCQSELSSRGKRPFKVCVGDGTGVDFIPYTCRGWI